MGEVTAKRRIKTATKDHITISMTHLQLHSERIVHYIGWTILLFGFAALLIVGMTV